MSRIPRLRPRPIRVIAALSVVGVALTTGAWSIAVTTAGITAPGTRRAILRFPYTSVADGGFAAFSAAGNAIVESRWMGPQVVYLKAGAPLFPFPLAKPGLAPQKYYVGAAISPDRKYFSTAVGAPRGRGWRVCIWNLSGGRIAPTVLVGRFRSGYPGGIAFSPDGRRLASILDTPRDWSVAIHGVRSGKAYRKLTFPRSVRVAGNPAFIAFSSSDALACLVSGRKVWLTCWNAISGSRLYSQPVKAFLACTAIAGDVNRRELLLGGVSADRSRKLLVAIVSGASGAIVQLLAINGNRAGVPHNIRWQGITHICVVGRGRFAVATEIGVHVDQQRDGRPAGRFLIIDMKRLHVRYRSPVLREIPWYADVSAGGGRILIAGGTRVYLMPLPFKL